MQTARKSNLPHLLPMLRFEFLKLSNVASIRTFSKDIYLVISGLLVKHKDTSEIKRIEEIYYDIRTVRDFKGNILAKRKQPNGELYKI